MPLLIEPPKPYSKTISQWLSELVLLPTLWPSDNNSDRMLQNMFKSSFLITYGFDGYDHTKNTVINTVSAESFEYTAQSIDPWLAAASFIGLPTRTNVIENIQVTIPETDLPPPEVVRIPSNIHSNDKNTITTHLPRMTLAQLGINLLGGWEWSSVSFEKKIWQTIGLLVKAPVIFPIKLLTILPKLSLNTLKLLTEFLPLILSTASIGPAKWFAYKTAEYSGDPVDKTAKEIQDLDKPSHWWKVLTLVTVPLTLVFVAIHVVFRLAYILGRALTSPLKSAAVAFASAQEIQIPYVEQSTSERITFYIGLFLGLISLILSASLWAIALPLLCGTVVAYLPTVAQLTTAVLQWPPIASLMSSFSVIFTTVGAGLQVLFGSLIAEAAAVLGIQLSTTLLAAALTLGALVTPIASLLSAIADKLSNMWALWHKGGPVTDYLLPFLYGTDKNGYIPLREPDHDLKKPHSASTETPSPGSKNAVLSAQGSVKHAGDSATAADDTGQRLVGDTSIQPIKLSETQPELEIDRSNSESPGAEL